MATVMVGKFLVEVDELDLPLVSAERWRVRVVKKGSGREYPYVVRPIDRKKTAYVHRELAAASPGQLVDHANGNTLDLRRSNLRCCTPQQNTWNRVKKLHSRTPKGVTKYRHKWKAYIHVDGRGIYLGLFDTELAAAKAYELASIKHMGAFALAAR